MACRLPDRTVGIGPHCRGPGAVLRVELDPQHTLEDLASVGETHRGHRMAQAARNAGALTQVAGAAIAAQRPACGLMRGCARA